MMGTRGSMVEWAIVFASLPLRRPPRCRARSPTRPGSWPPRTCRDNHHGRFADSAAAPRLWAGRWAGLVAQALAVCTRMCMCVHRMPAPARPVPRTAAATRRWTRSRRTAHPRRWQRRPLGAGGKSRKNVGHDGYGTVSMWCMLHGRKIHFRTRENEPTPHFGSVEGNTNAP